MIIYIIIYIKEGVENVSYNEDLWEKVMSFEEKAPKGIINSFDEDDIETIVTTMNFFGASSIWIRQTIFDLMEPKYRCFDWLAMCIMGRNNDSRILNNTALKVLVYSFIKSEGDDNAFIDDLRYSDYQIDESWDKIEIDI